MDTQADQECFRAVLGRFWANRLIYPIELPPTQGAEVRPRGHRRQDSVQGQQPEEQGQGRGEAAGGAAGAAAHEAAGGRAPRLRGGQGQEDRRDRQGEEGT